LRAPRRHINEEVGGSAAALNEHKLWHGTPALDNIYSILADGFKSQYSNMSGALGAGIYFAGAGGRARGWLPSAEDRSLRIRSPR
jgi:hypothetical protein